MRIVSSLILLVFISACNTGERNRGMLHSGDQISYNYHVRPILSYNCFVCHGPHENKREELTRFQKEPEKILETVWEGESPLGPEADKPETAALMQVVLAIYNVEEAITKT